MTARKKTSYKFLDLQCSINVRNFSLKSGVNLVNFDDLFLSPNFKTKLIYRKIFQKNRGHILKRFDKVELFLARTPSIETCITSIFSIKQKLLYLCLDKYFCVFSKNFSIIK